MKYDSLFTTRAIKNGVCLHLCCSSALVQFVVSPYVFVLNFLLQTALGKEVPN